MNVASLELCKELYELSRWEPDDRFWFDIDGKHSVHCGHEFIVGKEITEFKGFLARICPAYDLGYLLRKLPKYLRHAQDDLRFELMPQGYTKKGLSRWCAVYANIRGDIVFLEVADTPEDAACKLVIELIKEGIKPMTDPNTPTRPTNSDDWLDEILAGLWLQASTQQDAVYCQKRAKAAILKRQKGK